MNDIIKVSVIVPIHNVKKYIKQCIDSIVNQTLKDIEIILVDDCSTDGTSAILDDYAKRDERIQVIHNSKKLGAGGARNIGLRRSRGEYLSFLDSDDFFSKDLLEKIYFECKEADLDICIYDYAKFDDLKQMEDVRFQLSQEDEYLVKNKVFSINTIGDRIVSLWTCALWSRMIRREFVLQSNLWFQEIHNANDVFFSYTSLACAKRVKYVTYENPLLYYRVNIQNQLSSNRSKSPYCIYEALKEVTHFYQKNYSAYMQEEFYRCIMIHIVNSIKSIDQIQKKELVEFYRDEGLEKLGINKATEEGKITGVFQRYVVSILSYCTGDDFVVFSDAEAALFNNREKTSELKIYLSERNCDVILWGAGKLGSYFLEECNRRNICIKNVVDKDKSKEGTVICGYHVCSIEKCIKTSCIVLVTNSKWLEEIKAELEKMEFVGVLVDLHSFYKGDLELQKCIS